MRPEADPLPVYVGLGSNLGNPEAQVRRALDALGRIPGARLARHSRLYRSAPVGVPDQPDYVNGVALLETRLPALALLDALQAIEVAQGRQRDGTRWGPRTLDLDLLLYGAHRITGPRLEIPHPEMHRRPFVLVPLAEIAPPGLHIPGLGELADLRVAYAHTDLLPLA